MNDLRRHVLRNALVVAIGIGGMSAGHAQDAAVGRNFDVPSQPAASALNAFAEQADITLVFSQDLVTGITTRPLEGTYATIDGLRAMLEGTGLVIQRINDTTLSIVGSSRAGANAQTSAQPDAFTKSLETVTVTGTRIRGGVSPSPVITIDAQRISEEGFNDLGEVIRSLPQNFNGGQNPAAVSTSSSLGSGANGNVTGGSGLNLRGLGPDATLTLLNGRRMAYGGRAQSVDISAIPVEAVDRIEIVPDGASAIYGSDAVAGVGNVILKRDFEGVTVGTRYGTATSDGLTTREYTVTAGTTWQSGGVIATYKDSSRDPIYADQRSYADNLIDPYAIYPGSDQRSGLLSGYQMFGDDVTFKLDALRTERDQLFYGGFPTFYYHYTPETTTSLVSPSLEWILSNDWTLSAGAAWGEDDTLTRADMVTFATGVSSPVTRFGYSNESRTYEVGAEGPLFALRGGDARLAVGAGYRTNSLLERNQLAGTTNAAGEESSRFAYAELNLPLIGPDSNTAAVRRLMLTAAVRGEDYDSFGSVTTPKLGLIYSPNANFTLKASWGKSFKAPTLFQRYLPQFAYLDTPPSRFGGTGYEEGATVLSTSGGNGNLNPERARTWTASLAFHPEAVPGLEAELTWFDIDYTDRVVRPFANTGEALSNPIYSEFVIYNPTAEQQAEAIANATFRNSTGADYDPDDVFAMFSQSFINATRQQIRGIDLSSSYGRAVGAGRLTLRGSVSWLDSSQQTTSLQSSFDLAGSIYNPAKINGRAGAVWTEGGFTASVFANYTDGVREDFWSAGGQKTASFTTFDTSLNYRTGERSGAWSNLEFSLSAQNLFNRDPSLFSVAPAYLIYVPPYDATNTSVVGRYLSLAVSKHW